MPGKAAIALLLIVVANTSATGASLTQMERQRLTAHLNMTGSWLADEVAHLSPRQLQFRPSSADWTIMEIVEHLVVTGPIYWNDFQNAMKGASRLPPRPEKDAEVLWYGIDRTQHQKALASEAPRGQMQSLPAGIISLHKLHSTILQYVKTSDADLRGHVVDRERWISAAPGVLATATRPCWPS